MPDRFNVGGIEFDVGVNIERFQRDMERMTGIGKGAALTAAREINKQMATALGGANAIDMTRAFKVNLSPQISQAINDAKAQLARGDLRLSLRLEGQNANAELQRALQLTRQLQGQARIDLKINTNAPNIVNQLDTARNALRVLKSGDAVTIPIRGDVKQFNDTVAKLLPQAEAALKRGVDVKFTADTRPLDDARKKLEGIGALQSGLLRGVLTAVPGGNQFLLGAGASAAAVGIAALATAVAGLIAGMAKSVEIAKEAEQTYREMAIQFQGSAESLAAFSEQLGRQTGNTQQQIEKAIAQQGTLSRNYGLTTEQIKTLVERSADLAAVSGLDVVDAATRVQSAIRGEAEAAERLGLTLNSNAVKALANMTAEQRKNFETMDQGSKAQIIYAEFLRQSSFAQGAAAQQTVTATGAFQKLGAEAQRLGLNIGQMVLPPVTALVTELANAIQKTNDMILAARRVKEEIDRYKIDFPVNIDPLKGQAKVELGAGGIRREADRPVGSEESLGPSLADEASRREQARIQAAAKAAADAKSLADAEIEQAERTTTSVVRNIEARADAARAHQRDEKQRIDDIRTAATKAADDRREAEVAAIEAASNASRVYYQGLIDAAEAARDAAIEAAETRRDAALAQIETDVRRVQETRRQEDRTIQDRYDHEKQAEQDKHELVTRNLADEAEAIRDKGKAALDAIEREERALQQRHDTAIRVIDDEERRDLAAISDQERRIDRQERREKAQEGARKERDRLDDARRALKKAEDTRDEQIQDARLRLMFADTLQERIGAALALRRARTSGQERVEDAQRNVGEAQSQIGEAAKDARRAERKADLREDAENIRENARLRKQAIEDEYKADKQGLKDRQDAQKAATDTALEGIEALKRKEEDRHTAETRQIAERQEKEKRALEDVRLAQDNVFEDRKKKAQDDYEAQTEAIRKLYDGPGGILDGLRRQSAAAQEGFAAQKKAAQERYEEEKRQIDATHLESTRSLEAQTAKTIEELDKQKEKWQDWAKYVKERMTEAAKSANPAEAIKQALAELGRGPSGVPGDPAEGPSRERGTLPSLNPAAVESAEAAGKAWADIWITAEARQQASTEAATVRSEAIQAGAKAAATAAAEKFEANPLDWVAILFPPAAGLALINHLPDIGQRITEGWNNYWKEGGGNEKVTSTADETWKLFVSTWEGILGIKSPSTVFAEGARQTAQGWLNGWAEKAPTILTDGRKPFEDLVVWMDGLPPKFTVYGQTSGGNFITGYAEHDPYTTGRAPFEKLLEWMKGVPPAFTVAGTSSSSNFLAAYNTGNRIFEEGVRPFEWIIEWLRGDGRSTGFSAVMQSQGEDAAIAFKNGWTGQMNGWRPHMGGLEAGGGLDLGQPVGNTLHRNAQGGWIKEPTYLVGARSGLYGTAGEAGPEYINPSGPGVPTGGATVNITNHIQASPGMDTEALAAKIVDMSVTEVARVLESVQLSSPTPVSRSIPGAI